MKLTEIIKIIVTSSVWDKIFIGSLLLAIPIFTLRLFSTGYFWDEKYSDILKNIAILKLIILIVNPWFLECGKFHSPKIIRIMVWIAIFLLTLKYFAYEYCHLTKKWSSLPGLQ